VLVIGWTSSIETVKADVKAGRVIDGIEALCTVFTVHSLSRSRRYEGGVRNMFTGHNYGRE